MKRHLPIMVSLFSALAFLLQGGCGSTDDPAGLHVGTPTKVNLVIDNPGSSASKSLDKGLGSGNVSKATSLSPDSCAITVTGADINTISKTFTFASSVTVDLSVPIGSSRTFTVQCEDSSLTNDSITVGFRGSATADVSSGTTSVSLTTKYRNVVNDPDDSSGLASYRINQTGTTSTSLQLDFESVLTANERVDMRCAVELDTAGSNTSVQALDATTATCVAASPGNPTIRFEGGTQVPKCFYYNASGTQTFQGTGSWGTDAGGNTRATCSFGVTQFTETVDSNEGGNIAAACRLASTGNCDLVPNSGYAIYSLSANTNNDGVSALKSAGTDCGADSEGRDCASGRCVTLNTTDGLQCVAIGVDTNGGVLTTIGGSSGSNGFVNGNLTDGRFDSPNDLALSQSGDDLYLADTTNNAIRRIRLSLATSNASYITRCCGSSAGTAGSANGSCTGAGGGDARFSAPRGIIVNSDASTLYVGDTGNHNIRSVTISSGSCASADTLAGTGSAGAVNGTGTAASFSSPRGVEIDSQDTNLYVMDTGNHGIRKIVISSGVVTTLAGSLGTSGSTDGTGTAATFSSPIYGAIDSTDTFLYVTDSGNDLLRRIRVGSTDTETVQMDVTPGTLTGIAIDPTDTELYFSDQGFIDFVRKITIADGIGSGTATTSAVLDISDGLNNHNGLVFSHDGTSLYVADTTNHIIVQSD